MTLNASGPLSFGGATTGQSINLELGKSATALASINATDFRTLAGVASGQISVSNFYGKSNVKGWFASFNSASTENIFPIGINVSSTGNIVVGGYFEATSNRYGLVVLSSTPTVLYQKAYNNTYQNSGPTTTGQTFTPAIDSSGNIYLAANRLTTGGWGTYKYSSDLTTVTNYLYFYDSGTGSSITSGSSGAGTKIDSSGNVYVAYTQTYSSCCSNTYYAYIAKYNSSGTVVWKTGINPFGQRINDQALDSSGNVYVVGTNPVNLMGRFDTTNGAYTNWSFSPNQPYSIAVDSSSNKYILSTGGSQGYFNVMKLNSSNAISWARKLTSAGRQGTPKRIIVGGDGYIYACGSYIVNNSGPVRYPVIVKYDSSGTIQWQRVLYNATPGGGYHSYSAAMDIAYTATGLIVAIWIPDNTGTDRSRYVVASLPLDGSGTGSYTVGGSNITYAAGTFTDTTDTTATISSESYTSATATQGNNPTNSTTATSWTLSTTQF
jgi:hypothetical protein